MVGFAQPIASDLLESTVDNELGIQPGQTNAVHAQANAVDNAGTRRAKVLLNWNDNTEPDFAYYNVYRSMVSGGQVPKFL